MKRYLLVVTTLILLATMVGCAAPTATPVPPTKAPVAQSTTAPAPTAVPPTAAPTAAPKPQLLRINLTSWPDLVDPQKSSFVNEITLLQLMYEGLTRVDAKGNVVPGAAEKWETSADGKTMTFHLRAGLKRADGTALTAADFEYGYKRLVDPRVMGEYNTLIDDVVGAVEARESDPKASDADVQKMLDKVGVKATDANTLVVTFKQPVGYWAMIASTWVGWPSDKKAVDKDPDNWWNGIAGHNGNGPFKLAKWEDQKSMVFVPNPNYWGGKAKLDRLEFSFITESAVSFAAYQKGELDIIGVAAEDLATAKADPVLSKEMVQAAGAGTYYLAFHQSKPPFDKKVVRDAFGLAFDRDTWVRDILKGLGVPAYSFIPPGVPGYDETAQQPKYDPKAAVKMLVDNGYAAANSTADAPKVDCKKLGPITLTYAASARNHLRFQWIAGQFAATFGCPITLDPVDPTTYTALTKDVATCPQMYILGWIQDYPSPQNWLFIWQTGGLSAGRINYSNKAFDTALAAANAEADATKAIAKYQAAQKIYLADNAATMIWHQVNLYLVKPYVLGAKENFGASDSAWPGQYGPVWTYGIDTSKVPASYPSK